MDKYILDHWITGAMLFFFCTTVGLAAYIVHLRCSL